MPRYKIEKSLFEPVEIEVESGRTYTSVPLSPFLLREISKLEEQRKAGTLDTTAAITQQVALIFGLEAKDIEITDIRILTKILEYATEAMKGGKAGKITAEAAVEKNAPKPEAETTQ